MTENRLNRGQSLVLGPPLSDAVQDRARHCVRRFCPDPEPILAMLGLDQAVIR